MRRQRKRFVNPYQAYRGKSRAGKTLLVLAGSILAILAVLLLAAGLFTVVKLTGTDDFSQNNYDVLLLNEIAHKMVIDDMPPEKTAPQREYVILDINGNAVYDNRSDASEAITVETAMKRRYPYTYIIENNQITGSVVLTDSNKRFDSLRTLPFQFASL